MISAKVEKRAGGVLRDFKNIYMYKTLLFVII